MLDTMMKFGAFRVDYFHRGPDIDQKAFGFYLRSEISGGDRFSRGAKIQLYSGLMFIKQNLEFNHLVGIYLDVDSLDNLERPAYKQMKRDIFAGYFKRLFVLDENAIMGSDISNLDLLNFFVQVDGFDLFTCKNGQCVALEFAKVYEPVTA